jgi:hypothetical protein
VIGGLLTGIAMSPWMRAALRYGAIALAVLLFLLSLRRSGERAGRLAERLETSEKANDVQRAKLGMSRLSTVTAAAPVPTTAIAIAAVCNGRHGLPPFSPCEFVTAHPVRHRI